METVRRKPENEVESLNASKDSCLWIEREAKKLIKTNRKYVN